MAKEKSRVTLLDIATATGYTVNTVSRALKNKEDISRETCERIQQKAKEMGYVRNYLASSLRSGRTKTLAMIPGRPRNGTADGGNGPVPAGGRGADYSLLL